MAAPQTMVIRVDAGPGERFGPHAFDRSVGKLISLTMRATDDGPVIGDWGVGKLMEATIADDGSAAFLTVETVVDYTEETPE